MCLQQAISATCGGYFINKAAAAAALLWPPPVAIGEPGYRPSPNPGPAAQVTPRYDPNPFIFEQAI